MYSIIMGVISIAYMNHWDLRELLFDIIRSNFPNESIIKVNPEENPTILICSVFGDINTNEMLIFLSMGIFIMMTLDAFVKIGKNLKKSP